MSTARLLLMAASRGIRGGTIELRHRGDTLRLGDGGPLAATVTVHDERAYGAFLRGSKRLAASYRAGWWDCDDLTTLFRILYRSVRPLLAAADRAARAVTPVVDPMARLRRTDPRVDRHNIRAHYDLGNDFYELMLDETMAYSCAFFEHPDQPLASAQRAKFDRLCRALHLGPDDHLLEIGTGWGGLAVHAAGRYGCRVTTTTISQAQFDLASKRIVDAGVADRVTVLDRDYRDLAGTFDKLVSVEMIEAVDWRDHDAFFARCAQLIRPDGRVALQAIVIDDASFDRAKRREDFISADVFPGGCLPSVPSLLESAARAGLHLDGLHDIGEHYPETLRRWRTAVAEGATAVEAMDLGPAFLRHWDLYLTYCEAAFLERHISDVQVTFRR